MYTVERRKKMEEKKWKTRDIEKQRERKKMGQNKKERKNRENPK